MKTSAIDLEEGAIALMDLERRRLRTWTIDEFAGLTRGHDRRRAMELLGKLADCDLVRTFDEVWIRTERGDAVVAALADQDWAPYCDSLVMLEDVSSEAMSLIRAGSVQESTWRCLLVRARGVAPTLSTILSWRRDFRDGPTLSLPVSVLETVSMDFMMAAARGVPVWIRDREAIGQRAEAYSMRYEASRVGAANLLWVAIDVGDRYGYDIEVMEEGRLRAIEVKGSRRQDRSFFWTSTERGAAERLGQGYEIHYWGGISLDREPKAEYELLVAHGYPQVILDPASTLLESQWKLECVAWQVSVIPA